MAFRPHMRQRPAPGLPPARTAVHARASIGALIASSSVQFGDLATAITARPACRHSRSASVCHSKHAVAAAGGAARTTHDLRYRGPAKGSQVELQQEYRVGHDVAAIAVVGDIDCIESDAFVDIADPHRRGVETTGIYAVEGRCTHIPILRDLESCRRRNALARQQQTDERLRVVVSISQRRGPTIEIYPPFELQAANVEVLLVEPEA